MNIVEDGILRGGQGPRGEEKDGKHRSGIRVEKGGRRFPPKNRIKETKRKKHKSKRKRKAPRVELKAEKVKREKEEVRYEW